MVYIYPRLSYIPLGRSQSLTNAVQARVIRCEMQQIGSESVERPPRGAVPLSAIAERETISLGAVSVPRTSESLLQLSSSLRSSAYLILIAPDLPRDVFQPCEEQIKNGEHLLCAGYAMSRIWQTITVLYCSGRPIQGYSQPDPSSFEKLGSAGPNHWLDESKHQVLQNVYAYDVAPLVDVYSDCLHAMLCSPEFLGALGALVRTGRFPLEMVQRRAAVAAKPAAG